jgi:GDP-L-fucose synthase
VWGTGKAYREFVYVDDVATIAKWVLHNYNEPEPFIISPDEEINMAVLAQTIAFKMMGVDKIIYNHDYPDGQLKKPSDNSILKRCLPDFEFIPIQEGLSRTINWFLEEYGVHLLI